MDTYEKQFLELQQRLFHAEQENRKRSQDLSTVLDEIKRAVAEKRNAFENHTGSIGVGGEKKLTFFFYIRFGK